jgi:hypothetical protein
MSDIMIFLLYLSINSNNMKPVNNKMLVKKFTDKQNRKRMYDAYFDELKDDMKQIVLDYLNEVLPIIYSPDNAPDNYWNRKSPMNMNGLFDGGGYQIIEHIPTGERCFIIYFDCDSYHFEGEVFITEDCKEIFFTDWSDSNERTEEIAGILIC